MSTSFKVVFCLFSLLLAGCNLDIDIIGKGRVYSTDGSIDCTHDCRYTSLNGIKEVELKGEADAGFRFLGLLSSEIYNSPMPTTATVPYGFSLKPPPQPSWIYRPVIQTRVTAVFHPEDDILKAAGTNETICIVTQSHTLKCWGLNANRFGALSNVTDLITSNYALCVVHDAKLDCWNESEYRDWPIPDFITHPQQVVLGYDDLCVLYEDEGSNKVHCVNRAGLSLPAVPALSNPTALRTQHDIYCADDNGATVCWGNYYYGQSKVPTDLGNVTAFAAGDHHTCAIAQGQVRCWGGNEYGQSNVPDDLIAPSAITAGFDHTCVHDSGEIRCWGQNAVRLPLTGSDTFNPALFSSYEYVMCVIDPGQSTQPLCRRNGEAVLSPQLPAPPSALAVTVGGPTAFVAAIVDNQLYHWNESGLLPAEPIALENSYLLAGGERSFCVGETGATWVRCWNSSENTNLPASLTEPQSLSLSPFHGCAVQDGTVICWGSDVRAKNRGQMAVPTGLPSSTQVDTGRFHSCVLGINQRLYCWGESPVIQ
ncbi:MAG TPA: RCC1 domain-containing protein [Dongiaceae bacterium]|nr:RCC1 domain-containing protein [Dongiaceae bacterium]